MRSSFSATPISALGLGDLPPGNSRQKRYNRETRDTQVKRDSIFAVLPQPLIFVRIGASIKPDSIADVARQLIGRRGVSSYSVANKLAEKYPQAIRNLGLSREFGKEIHVGHVKPYSTHPHLGRSPGNMRLETKIGNISTGNRKKPYAYWKRNSEGLRKISNRLVRADAFKKVRAGFLWGAVLELPFAAIEEVQAVRRGDKTKWGAVKSGGRKTVFAGVLGAVTGAAAWGLGAVGVTVTSSVTVPLGVVGGGIYLVGSVFRVRNALQWERTSVLTEGMKFHLLQGGDLAVVDVAAKVVQADPVDFLGSQSLL